MITIDDEGVALGEYTSENPFVDITSDDWYYDSVMYAYKLGLMNGTSDDQFSPDTPLTRAMVVTVLYRLMDEPETADMESPFTDLDEDAYYIDAVKWAFENGIVLGLGDDTFAPDEIVSRQDIATIFMRYIKYIEVDLPKLCDYDGFGDEDDIVDYALDSIMKMFEAGILFGRLDNKFDPETGATRAEFTAILQRFLVNTETVETANTDK